MLAVSAQKWEGLPEEFAVEFSTGRFPRLEKFGRKPGTEREKRFELESVG